MSKHHETVGDISKRLDRVEGEILLLRERTHENGETNGVIVMALERYGQQLMSVFDNQDKFSEKVLETFKDHAAKFKEIEEETSKIKLVTSHWKAIVWIMVISSAIGFAFDNGVKNILKGVTEGKLTEVTQVIANERNGQ